jgi:hypothetical protein
MGDPLFTTDDLLELRSLSEDSLPHECMIARSVRVRSAGARIQETFAPVAVGVPCRVSQGAVVQAAIVAAEQLQALGRWVVVFPLATDVREGDRLTCTGESAEGDPWTRVLSVIAPTGPRTYEVMRKVIAMDVGAGGR